jgi:hypothetical protein
MSDLVKEQVEIEDLIARYEALEIDVKERLSDVAGKNDEEQIRRLEQTIYAQHSEVAQILMFMDRRPHLEIGQETEIRQMTNVGQIVSIEDGVYKVLIPEQTVTARWTDTDARQQRHLMDAYASYRKRLTEVKDQPEPKVGDSAGVYVPVYLDSVIKAIHNDGSATVRVEAFTLQVLPDYSDSDRHETTWWYKPADPVREQWEQLRQMD